MLEIFLEKLKKEAIDTTIKNTRNRFRLEKENKTNQDRIIRDNWNFFRLEKESKVIIDRVIRDIGNLFAHEGENYYKPLIVSNFLSNNYIECKSKCNRLTLSVEEYLNEIKPCLKDIIDDRKKIWHKEN